MVTFCNTRVWSENLEKHFHSSKNLCSWRFCGTVFPWLMRCSWQAKDHVKQILHYMVHSTGSPLIGCPLIVLRFLKNVHSSHSTSMNFSIVLFWAMFLYFILIVRISHSTVFWCSTLTVLWGDPLYLIITEKFYLWDFFRSHTQFLPKDLTFAKSLEVIPNFYRKNLLLLLFL